MQTDRTCEADAEAAVARFLLAAGLLPSDSGGGSVEVARVREAIATQVVAAQQRDNSGSRVASGAAGGVVALLDNGGDDGPNAAAPSATASAGAAPTGAFPDNPTCAHLKCS